MSARPIIGIPTQTQEPASGDSVRWSVGRKYVRSLTGAGAVPWLIPLIAGAEATLQQIFDHLDGLLLMGGADVDPAAYGELRHPRCGPTDPARDWVEIQLARWAVRDGKPLFGICRGIQLVNVALGGTLYQDLEAQFSRGLKHDNAATPADPARSTELVHKVQVSTNSLLRQIVDDKPLSVNSMHHQGIKDLAPTLVASGIAADGLIEAIEGGNNTFLLGVQWHPEELIETCPDMNRLFTAFVAACRQP